MNNNLKLEYKVGAIEFRAEGPADAVEQQRINFMNTVLPAAVDAMVRTQSNTVHGNYVEPAPQTPMLESSTEVTNTMAVSSPVADFSRTSLTSFLKTYGVLTDQDFTLFAAYFDELKNGVVAFSSDSVKQYYLEGRRTAYSNNSELLRQLAKKGYIMDAPTPDGAKAGKHYMLTDAGMTYIKDYVPKDVNVEKKPRVKAKKTINKAASAYAPLNADDLNLKQYPSVKSLLGTKERVILAMFIVTNEGKGEWFTADDVSYILENIFETTVNTKSVNGVFDRNKSLFACEHDPDNKKAIRRKLLSAAKDYAKAII